MSFESSYLVMYTNQENNGLIADGCFFVENNENHTNEILGEPVIIEAEKPVALIIENEDGSAKVTWHNTVDEAIDALPIRPECLEHEPCSNSIFQSQNVSPDTGNQMTVFTVFSSKENINEFLDKFENSKGTSDDMGFDCFYHRS